MNLNYLILYQGMIHGETRVANVVLDIGSYHTFAGEAGFENPKFASYSYLTENPYKKQQYKAGNEALNSQNINKQIHSIFESVGPAGKIQKFQFDINRLDKFVETILFDNLGLQNCNISLLIAEDVAVDLEPSQVLKQRQKIADYLLEGMELSNIAFIKKPILSTFSLGRTSATVLDSGHSFSHCSIIEDGYCTFNKTLKIGGSLILSMMQSQILAQTKNKPWKITQQYTPQPLPPSYVQFHRIIELESKARKFPHIPPESTMVPQNYQIMFTLPDKQNIKISRADLVDPFINWKQFYNKYLINKSNSLPPFLDWSYYKTMTSYRGLEQLVYDTINQYLQTLDQKNKTVIPSIYPHNNQNGIEGTKKKLCQLSYQDLLNNVILTGGNINFSNIAWTIDQGIRKQGGNTIQCPLNFNKDANGNSHTSNNSTSWIGGSIVCNLPIFNHFWIKVSEWKQVGSVLASSKALGSDIIKTSVTVESQQYTKKNRKLQILSKKCP